MNTVGIDGSGTCTWEGDVEVWPTDVRRAQVVISSDGILIFTRRPSCQWENAEYRHRHSIIATALRSFVPASETRKQYKKTVLDGYRASGDGESFCFDKRTTDAAMTEARNALRNNTEPDAEHIDPHEGKRVYPGDLLPDTGGRKGRWTITVSFTPEDSLGSRL